jgi:glycosyltransferase involved in cell wall biosynthesis
MSEDLVSVIIPTYNRNELLHRAIRSAVRQSYRSLEVVVFDNGSSPPASIPDELTADSRVSMIRSDTNLGCGESRNISVARARGRWIAFLDDDDEWLPDKIARQLDALVPGAAGVDCGHELWDGDRLVRRLVPDPDRDLARELLERPMMAPSCVLLDRRVFEELGGFPIEINRCEDWELWLRLADRYSVVALPDVLVRREASHRPVRDRFKAYSAILDHLRPRAEALPQDERDVVVARHTFMLGVYHAMLGDRGAARAYMWKAWRMRPSDPRPVLHLGRTLVGERVWARLAAAAARVSRRT